MDIEESIRLVNVLVLTYRNGLEFNALNAKSRNDKRQDTTGVMVHN